MIFLIIGVTGISGAGKSTLSRTICKLKNAKWIDADDIAKDMQRPGIAYYNDIVKCFGKEILKENKEIDRNILADIVFKDKAKKETLDRLTFDYIIPKIKGEAMEFSETGISVIDAALLFEFGLDNICDITIGVISKMETCLERICKRDGICKEGAKLRLNNQKQELFFKLNCDYCINNDGMTDLNKQILQILNGENLSNKDILHLYDDDIEYLQFRKLLEYSDKITHCYTLKPLDFRIDGREKFKEDYKKICKVLNLDEKQIYRPHQTHSNNVKIVKKEEAGIHKEEFENVDGLITNKKDKILSLVFADCICLLFYDPIKNVIGNVHSGWSGTYKEIAKTAVKALKEKYNVNPKDLICGIAPSIRNCCFEVDKDVRDMFYEKFKDISEIDEIIRKSENNNKYYIDTVLINKIILKNEGLEECNIIDSEICTKCNFNKLHSYRIGGDNAGRNASIITICDVK